MTRSEDTYEKNTTCWPATAHDVTTGVPQYKCRREDTSSAFSSSLTGLFEACRVNLVRVQFSNSTMASTSKAFRKCVDPCPRYLTPDDTHDCWSFVWAWSTHAMSLRGRFACIVSGSLWGSSALACPSFRGKRGSRLLPAIQDPPLPRHGGEWNRGVRSWMWPISWKGTAPFSRVGREREWAAGLWWCDLSDIIRCSS